MTEPIIVHHDEAVHIHRTIDGKRHTIVVSREAIEDHLRAAAMTDAQRVRFVRNKLARILTIVEDRERRGAPPGYHLIASGEL